MRPSNTEQKRFIKEFSKKSTLLKDFRLAVVTLADSQQWDRQVLKGIRYTENVSSPLGQPRRDSDKNPYRRRYAAQRSHGMYFRLRKTVMTQLEAKNLQVHQNALAGIRINCLHLLAKLTEVNTRRCR
uniref:Transposase n=1 Tax=Panagrellus redivivus TaxID=6233 RepID=A0A7E4VS50_PANRE